jgi:hypothetical protein
MGRTSKLFPLSSRKTSIASDTSTPSTRESQSQLSKAERLLGTSGFQDASRQKLPGRPSYMSLNPSISEFGDEADYDDFSTPDHFGLDPLPLRLANLQHSNSQDGLGRRISSAGSYSRSFISNHSRRIKSSWSSATLKTHYDASMAPASTSHQTSNIAVRDRASRRGMPPVLESAVHHHQRPSTASATSSAYESQDSMDRATALPDISRLYPRFVQHGSPSSRSADSPPSSDHTTHPSSRFPGVAPVSRPTTSTGSIKKVASKTIKGRLSVDAFPSSMKIFSRRQNAPSPVELQPRTRPRKHAKVGPKNWWDTFPVEDEASDAESEHDPNLATPTEDIFPSNKRATPSPRPPDLQLNTSDRPNTVYTIRKMGSSHEIISARSSTTLRSPLRPLSRGSRPSSRMITSDLHETSILSTPSSSEAESEAEEDSFDELPPTHYIRDSIAVSDIDIHHVGQAQALHVKQMRMSPKTISSERRPSIASVSSIPTTTDSGSVKFSKDTPPSYLSVPSRSNRSRKSGHTRQPSSIPEDSDTSSQVASPTSPPASMRGFSASQSDGRKLMAVTEEEEALLELMRRKRADKAAQRDSGLASIKSDSTTRSNRPFSNLSGTSSILDSFPLSRSQRSSLLASRATTQQSSPIQPIASKDNERGRKRQSVATTATDNTYYSIDSRIESPTRLKYAFTPHLSLASLDISLSSLQSSASDDTATPASETLDSPTTPITLRESADILIREASSKRNSSASYAYGDRNQTSEEILHEKLQEKLRRKTTSNTTRHHSPELENFEKPKKSSKATQSNLTSSDDEVSPKLGSDNSSTSGSSKRASTLSRNTSECGSTCDHFFHGDSKGYNRSSVGYGAGIGTRCSVSEDVLAAWGSLGGWREQPGIMG